MALFLFTRAILEGRPIDVFNEGRMQRDFTYVDDIVEGIRPQSGESRQREIRTWSGDRPDPAIEPAHPTGSYNIGNDRPSRSSGTSQVLEKCLGRTGARKNFLPMQPGDVPATRADVVRPGARHRVPAPGRQWRTASAALRPIGTARSTGCP
mgnify:CR=1 FL=1